jgi:hypothetical protein
MDIIMIMRKVAIGLAALTIATAGSTLTASALPGEASLGIAQSVGHADNNNIDKVFFRRRWARRGVVVHHKFVPAYGFHRGVVVHKHVW